MRRLICLLRGHKQLTTWTTSTSNRDIHIRHHKCSYCEKIVSWREYKGGMRNG